MIWLIGSGTMALSYAKVLLGLKREFKVIGRGETSAKNFEVTTGIKVFRGGLQKKLNEDDKLPDFAIIATGINTLYNLTSLLIAKKVKNILVEKPGALNKDEINKLADLALNSESHVFIAYNRRFYSSVLKAKEMILEDGGLKSMIFEFTEWSHEIVNLPTNIKIKNNWLLANSSHVIDLAFFIAGPPVTMNSFVSGSIEWHPLASIFVGSGISEKNVLFSYYANWEGPGRWSIEFITDKHRYILKPLEKLQIQEIGSVKIEFVDLEDQLDSKYKPGLFIEVKSFLEGNYENLLTLEEQRIHVNAFYEKILHGSEISK